MLDATLLDDTPAANPETREWLQSLSTPTPPAPTVEERNGDEARTHRNGAPTWLAQAVDAYILAKDALAAGQEEKAFAIMRVEIASQRSGRHRFRRTMQTIELAIAAGKDSIAQPLLEDIAAAIETHKLDAWEDPEQIASDLSSSCAIARRFKPAPLTNKSSSNGFAALTRCKRWMWGKPWRAHSAKLRLRFRCWTG